MIKVALEEEVMIAELLQCVEVMIAELVCGSYESRATVVCGSYAKSSTRGGGYDKEQS